MLKATELVSGGVRIATQIWLIPKPRFVSLYEPVTARSDGPSPEVCVSLWSPSTSEHSAGLPGQTPVPWRIPVLGKVRGHPRASTATRLLSFLRHAHWPPPLTARERRQSEDPAEP